ncbi:MAG TPA: hypothetical protein VF311_08625 [Terriglobales bacterium]
MPKRLLSLGCWLMVVILPLDAVAADAVGMLTSIGTVLVDNKPAPVTGAVFAGEVIETKTKSKAVVVAQGKSISLAENSSVRLGAKVLELQSGAVLVSSTSSVVQVDNVTITANSATPSKFLARKINGELQVLALEGTIYVSDGQQTTPVPTTKGVSLPLPRSGRKGIAWLYNDDVGILIVVAAAITAGVTLGIVNAQNAKPVSPAAP